MNRTKRSLIPAALIAALLFPLSLTSVIAVGQDDVDKTPSKDLVFEQLQTVYRYQNDGSGTVTQTARIRAVTGAGRDQIGQFYFPYSSGLEDLKIDYFRTVKKDGSVLSVDPSQAVEMASPLSESAPMFSDLKLKVMVARDLDVGDALEYQVERIVKVPLKPGDFWALHFQNRRNYVDSEVVVLDVPAGRQLSLQIDPAAKPEVEEKNGRKIYRWTLSNPKPVSNPETEQQPLFVASTLTDWKQVGDWYLGLEWSRVQPTAAIRQLAAQLTTGKTTPREKVESLYAYVSEHVRYVALEFGIGGYQPHAATDVLSNGYGDCKDKTGLLQALLTAAGIKSYPALLNASRNVMAPGVPTPAQFDHVITVVPIDGQLLWMDPTLGVAPLGVLPVPLRGRQALLLESGASKLTEVPVHPLVPEKQTVTVTGKLDANGKLTLSDDLKMQGMTEVLFRTLYRLGNEQALSTLTKNLAALQAPGATAGDATHSDPLDLSRPFTLKMPVTDSDFFPPFEKTQQVRVPTLGAETGSWTREIDRARSQEDEAAKDSNAPKPQPITLAAVGTVESTLDLEIDPSYQIDLPLSVHADRPFATYDSTYSFENGHLTVHRVVRAKADTLPASDWQAFEAFTNIVHGDLAQTLQLRRAAPVNVEASVAGMSADEMEQEGNKALQGNDPFVARSVLVQATHKDPKSKTAWLSLGRADLLIGLFDDAERALQTQIKLSPDNSQAYGLLGQVYLNGQQYEKAIEEFQKQLAVNPLDRLAYSNLGQVYGILDLWDKAAQAWSKAAAMAHGDALVYTQWGDALLRAGELDDGRAQLKRALEINRTDLNLNNVAYGLAEAGVDLDQADGYARSAVAQGLAGVSDTNSLEVPREYNARLYSLGAFLDTLGWVDYAKKDYATALSQLQAAYTLRPSSDGARHLAQVSARLDRPDDTLRYYAWSMLLPGWTGRAPQELTSYLESHFGGAARVAGKLAGEDQAFYLEQRLTAPASSAWPAGAATDKAVMVRVAALVDAKGTVREAEAVSGDEPYRSAALREARAATLAPLAWSGQSLSTVRSLNYVYWPDKHVTGFWSFGKPEEGSLRTLDTAGARLFNPGLLLMTVGETERGLAELHEALALYPDSPYAGIAHSAIGQALLATKDYAGAATELHTAAKDEPDRAATHRALGEALAGLGDRDGAVMEFREAVRLDPGDAEAHFALGTELEAASSSRDTNKADGAKDVRAAYEQYRLAHQLAPGLPAYAAAFERLARQLGGVP
jgi:tetratricopeptide (TPR) repeat protein